MNEDLELEYLHQVRLINEIEIGGCKMLIYKNPKNKSVIRMGYR